ncbi:MAG: RpiB/LacA/LacB family sugar-phosphate isomerase [Candidatus Pacebacteria bacterium]|nr:RpiB/LacA/LacB family sugar-phosphate isomerase [Candidatus Paceibacterota bacterium]
MIFLGADHGGFALKEHIKQLLGQKTEDCGAFTLNPDDDYPTYAQSVATRVLQDPENNSGILVCRSGGGMAIAANRFTGIRAVECRTSEEVRWARNDDHANIMTLSAQWVDPDQVETIVKTFIETPYGKDERYHRRVQEIEKHYA